MTLSQASRHNLGPIFIKGERGSGKEVAAHLIHYFSKRREGPFIPVLVSALAETLQLDELFGHEKHSFTGAAHFRKGKFLAATGGTIFLDEIGDLPPATQVALLRAIEIGEIQPLGRDLPLRVDVQIIAATNRNLAKLVADGRFRPDLYDRIRLIEIEIPPLRERTEDIRTLARFYMSKYCVETSRDQRINSVCGLCGGRDAAGCLTEGFYRALESYDWPGNVRELRNLMAGLATTCSQEVLNSDCLPSHMSGSWFQRDTSKVDLSLHNNLREHIIKVLSVTGGNQTRAAKMLGIARTTLQAKMKRLDIKWDRSESENAEEP